MRRRPTAFLLAVLLGGLLPATAAAQELARPDGWKVRFDRPGASEADLVQFVEMPPGWHITTGPAGIFWDPERTATGDFRVEMDVFLFDPGGRREAFGLFFGGTDLEGPEQSYGYFLVRDGGEYILKERAGAEAPTIRGWTGHDAVRSFRDRESGEVSVLNELAVEAGPERVRFFVNGEEVDALPRERLPVDGVVGVRVNHALNLHVARLEVVAAGG